MLDQAAAATRVDEIDVESGEEPADHARSLAVALRDLEVLELLAHRGAIVSYTDPYVAAFKHASLDLQHVDEAIAHKGIDCGVIITDHKVFDYSAMIDRFPLLVDTRNALKGVNKPHLFRL